MKCVECVVKYTIFFLLSSFYTHAQIQTHERIHVRAISVGGVGVGGWGLGVGGRTSGISVSYVNVPTTA